MREIWVFLGAALLIVALADVFLVILNYDEMGFVATRLCRWQWYCLRIVTRRLPPRWRPFALRQVTGLNVLLSVTTWLGLVVSGFGFMYFGLMEGANFEYEGRGVGPGLFSAMYLSAAQLSTVGTSQVVPQTNVLRALTIAETLSAPLLITLILTFLIGVYQVVRDLRNLSASFSYPEHGASEPLAVLEPYFPNGVGLDEFLQEINGGLWSYADGLRLHHVAYFFQSGRDHFSLPHVLRMLGETLAALRWGLPSESSISRQPLLSRMIFRFDRFLDYLHDQLGWTDAIPVPISFEEFSAIHQCATDSQDPWCSRFLCLTRAMERMERRAPPSESRDAYLRYRQWLPFAYRSERAMSAVSWDLDYQPDVAKRVTFAGRVDCPARDAP
jgi:hypothetical protein